MASRRSSYMGSPTMHSEISVAAGSGYALKPSELRQLRDERRAERKRIRGIKSTFRTHGGGPERKPRRKLVHMNLNGAPRKTTTYKEQQRLAAIDRENRRLHGNLSQIYTAPPKKSFTDQMKLDTNTRIAAGLEGDEPSLAERGRAARRQQELLEVILQNQAIHSRLSSVRGVMDRHMWDGHAEKHEEYVRRRAKMPFVLRGGDDWDGGSEYSRYDDDPTPRRQQCARNAAQREAQHYAAEPRGRQQQRRAVSQMEMQSSREITGISMLDEETTHLNESRRRGARSADAEEEYLEDGEEEYLDEEEQEGSPLDEEVGNQYR